MVGVTPRPFHPERQGTRRVTSRRGRAAKCTDTPIDSGRYMPIYFHGGRRPRFIPRRGPVARSVGFDHLPLLCSGHGGSSHLAWGGPLWFPPRRFGIRRPGRPPAMSSPAAPTGSEQGYPSPCSSPSGRSPASSRTSATMTGFRRHPLVADRGRQEAAVSLKARTPRRSDAALAQPGGWIEFPTAPCGFRAPRGAESCPRPGLVYGAGPADPARPEAVTPGTDAPLHVDQRMLLALMYGLPDGGVEAAVVRITRGRRLRHRVHLAFTEPCPDSLLGGAIEGLPR